MRSALVTGAVVLAALSVPVSASAAPLLEQDPVEVSAVAHIPTAESVPPSELVSARGVRGTVPDASLDLPVYGNWCGPGHGGGPAVDTLDALCRQHDLCYEAHGYFSAVCDRQLVQGINRDWSRMTSRERFSAWWVRALFSLVYLR